MDKKNTIIDFAHLTQLATDYAIKFAIALLIFFVGRWIVKRIVNIFDRILHRSKLDPTVITFLGNVLYGILIIVVVLAALNNLGVHTTSMAAILGGATVAIGLSLKDQLANFAAGVIIVIFRPFLEGDFVNINGKEGTVKSISLVNTRLITINNHEIVIPNGTITTGATTNYTSLPDRRVDITVGVGYSTDLKVAKQILIKLAKANALSLTDPEPVVRVTALADNSVDLTLNVWAKNKDWWTLQCDLLEQIKYALDDNSIDIPYPQRSLHVTGLKELLDQRKQNSKDDADKQPVTASADEQNLS